MTTVSELALLGRHFESFRPKLEKMVRRRLDDSWRNKIEPADVVAEAYVRGHKRWLDDRDKTHVDEYWWWYRLSLDCLIEEQRRLCAGRRDINRAVGLPSHASRFLGGPLGTAITTPSQAAGRRELEERLHGAIDGQKDEYRELLWMRYYEKLSFTEIAKILNVTPNAVQKRHVQAIKDLAKRVDV